MALSPLNSHHHPRSLSIHHPNPEQLLAALKATAGMSSQATIVYAQGNLLMRLVIGMCRLCDNRRSFRQSAFPARPLCFTVTLHSLFYAFRVCRCSI
jgi:hypothetical protein